MALCQRVVAFSRHDVSPTCAQRTCCGKVLSLTLRQDEREMGKAQGFRELERFLTLYVACFVYHHVSYLICRWLNVLLELRSSWLTSWRTRCMYGCILLHYYQKNMLRTVKMLSVVIFFLIYGKQEYRKDVWRAEISVKNQIKLQGKNNQLQIHKYKIPN